MTNGLALALLSRWLVRQKLNRVSSMYSFSVCANCGVR